MAINNFSKLVGKTKYRQMQEQIAGLDKEAQTLENRKAELKPVIENYSATTLQTAMKNKRARDTLKQTRISKNTAATTIQKTFTKSTNTTRIIVIRYTSTNTSMASNAAI